MEILLYAKNLFISGFYYPGITFYQLVAGIGIAIVFGAIWYTAYWTPLLGKPSAWAVLAFSAFFTWLTLCFIQVPLQYLTSDAFRAIWSDSILMKWMLLAIIPQILYSGLVQEGAKLVPVVFLWKRAKKDISVKTGLLLGMVSGLGFGLFEAVWIHNSVFISGWDFHSSVATTGIIFGLLPFWERFFTVAFHMGASALAGWGLASGKGWQSYLIVSFVHAALNYSVVLLNTGHFMQLDVFIYVAVISLITAAVALWLRFTKNSYLEKISNN